MGDPDTSRAGFHRPSLALSLISSAGEEGLRFEDVCVDVEEMRVLWEVSGHAAPGHVLAVMGPSGSGKTTLLNTLAGHTAVTSGTITLHGQKLSKKNKRRISYVLQNDLFFPNLTLRETLRYSALLRLPREMSFREKLEKVEETIQTLRLQDCADTSIGSALVRGLSGGEKKRANIGCELLTDPELLLLDEPTSGLDSTSALSLLMVVTQLAKNQNKIVVSSLHQPSSQMYHMFDGLLLLAKGKVAYFGPASEAMDFMATKGLRCTLHYNPSDYLLEMVSQDESRKVLIGEDPNQAERPPRQWWRRWLRSIREAKQGSKEEYVPDMQILEYPHSPQLLRQPPVSASYPLASLDTKPATLCTPTPPVVVPRKWPTPWYWQFLVLTVRTFRQSRHVILSKAILVQSLLITLVCSLIWFQVPKEEDSIEDRYGLLFFSIVFWGFNALINSLTSFPAERVVIRKERASGSYHLSAYYLAKTLSELPLLLVLPSIFIVVVYWVATLNVSPASFFGCWLVMLINSFTAQSVGLLIGATVMDSQQALVVAVVFMLSSLLVGGFYVKNLPSWLSWVQYLSWLAYSFDALLILVFTSDQQFLCGEGYSDYDECSNVTNATLTMANSSDSTPVNYIPGTAVLDKLEVTIPLYGNILAMLGFSLIARFLAYLSLRFLHRT